MLFLIMFHIIKSWVFVLLINKKMISKNYKSNDIFNVVIKSNFKKWLSKIW